MSQQLLNTAVVGAMHRVKALADFSRELLGMNKKSLGIDEGLAEGDRDPWIKVTGYRTCKVTNVNMGYNLKLARSEQNTRPALCVAHS